MDTNSNLNNTVNLTKELDKLMSEIQNKNVQEKFPVDFESNIRVKRQSCPGGVGNFGFNSFNFMTFVLLTLNAVANTNNNINNNNNNNNDINYNTINQDSNNLVSNSENTNMVMAVILPMPGKRSLEKIDRNTKHQISKRCSEKKHLDVTSLLKLELLEETKKILRIMASRPECEGFAVCQALKSMTTGFLRDVINLELLEAGKSPFVSMIDCTMMFPLCM